MYLLDTSTVSDFIKGESSILQKIKNTSPSLLFLSSISYMEITYNLERKPNDAKKIKYILDDFLSVINLIDFTKEDGVYAGRIGQLIHEQGQSINPLVLLMSGIAANRNLILVASNLEEFQRVPNLICENWRKNTMEDSIT